MFSFSFCETVGSARPSICLAMHSHYGRNFKILSKNYEAFFKQDIARKRSVNLRSIFSWLWYEMFFFTKFCRHLVKLNSCNISLKTPHNFWMKFWNSGHSAIALLSRLTADPTVSQKREADHDQLKTGRRRRFNVKKRSPVNLLALSV